MATIKGKAIRISRHGGPEVMEYVDVDVPDPGPGEARVRQYACGVNFIDVYFRTGLYEAPLPASLGMEAAGVVEAVGPGVTEVQVGDRVAYTGRPIGAYADVRNVPSWLLVRLPEQIPYDTAAAMMLQGMTVQYLFHQTAKLKAGDTILFHAVAGGVGLIACQWARALGVTMIGTVGSDEKAELARAHGCAHVINYNKENFVERVKDITHGAKLPVVYDSVGKDTFTGSLDCLQPQGLMVSFGNSSGAVPPFSLTELSSRGGLFITRPTLFAYASTRDKLEKMAADVIHMVGSGKVGIDIHQRYSLADAAQAHVEMEARRTTGKTILVPETAGVV